MAQEICVNCGIAFTIPDVLQAELRRNHKLFYCPNGHGQYYSGKSDLELENEKIARLESTLRIKDGLLDTRGKEIQSLKWQRAALRAVITRFKNQRKKPMDGEIVKIELTPEGRLQLTNQLTMQIITKAGVDSYSALNLGFELKDGWPLEGEILLSQLVVLAAKLKMQITIGDINLSPRK